MSDDKRRLMADLIDIAEETRLFEPPYIPSRYLQDLAQQRPARTCRALRAGRAIRPTASSDCGRRNAST